jgi:PIN domain nuclease of toxin-antitoxin system
VQVLLDTQVIYIAYAEGVEAFPKKVRTLLADPGTERMLSSASLLEIAVKNSIGKVSFPEERARQAVADLKLNVIPFTPGHAYRMFSLPLHHRDPFDRMIIATALAEEIPVIGSDRLFKPYKGLKVIW